MDQSKAAIVFSFNDSVSVTRIASVLLRSGLDEIVFAMEDDPESLRFLAEINDPRLKVSYSSTRLGKPEAYNRAVKCIKSDLVFLLSSDISFSEDIFDKISDRISPESPGALVKVSPSSNRVFMERVSTVMWDMRDIELEYYSKSGEMISGGEFLAIRRRFLNGMPDVINDDEYLCLRAQGRGGRLAYYNDIMVENRVPDNLQDFLTQRRRVILGHMEMQNYGYSSPIKAFDRSHPGRTFRIFLEYVRRRRSLFYLMIAIILEAMTTILSLKDLKHGKATTMWDVAKSTKFMNRY